MQLACDAGDGDELVSALGESAGSIGGHDAVPDAEGSGICFRPMKHAGGGIHGLQCGIEGMEGFVSMSRKNIWIAVGEGLTGFELTTFPVELIGAKMEDTRG